MLDNVFLIFVFGLILANIVPILFWICDFVEKHTEKCCWITQTTYYVYKTGDNTYTINNENGHEYREFKTRKEMKKANKCEVRFVGDENGIKLVKKDFEERGDL